MKVLVGCEESQKVTRQYRRFGFESYSCDLVPTRGNKNWHLRMDVMKAIDLEDWDIIILHPDCTAMALSGNRWYGRGMPMFKKRLEAIEWTTNLWNKAINKCNKVVLENPASVIFKHLNYDHMQYIQPWQFGHGETKKTGLAFKGCGPLTPTNIVEGREQRIWKMAPSPTRKRDRSETYDGIAEALALQIR